MYDGTQRRRKPDQSLSYKLADASAAKTNADGSLTVTSRTGGRAPTRNGYPLERPNLPGDAALLAEDNTAFDPASGPGTWQPQA
jgi:hypothetical protein